MISHSLGCPQSQHIAEAHLQFLSLPSSGIKGMHHHACFMRFMRSYDSLQGYKHSYGLNHILSLTSFVLSKTKSFVS